MMEKGNVLNHVSNFKVKGREVKKLVSTIAQKVLNQDATWIKLIHLFCQRAGPFLDAS